MQMRVITFRLPTLVSLLSSIASRPQMTAPSSRPESSISQSGDDDEDANSTTFHDVDDDHEPPTSTTSPSPDSGALDATTTATITTEEEDAQTPERDSDAPAVAPPPSHDELVAGLRGEITDLTSQVTSLNGKLVKSYTTRGDLEDALHDSQELERQLRLRVRDLERDKDKWTKEIEQGGWVERDHVQGEMQRLMTKVVEETQTRQTAVQAHSALENEVENLTSNLFAEANKMVAFERLARARAEDKTRQVEDAGTSMQALLEDVQVGLRDTVTKLERRDAQVAELKRRLAAHGEMVPEDPAERTGGGQGGQGGGIGGGRDGGDDGDLGGSIIFSDGQHLDVAGPPTPVRDLSHAPIPSQFASPRLLTSALPYQEFLTFVTYLRQLRVTTLARPPDPPSAFGHPALSTRAFSSDPPPTSTFSSSSSGAAQGSAALLSPAQLLAPHLLLSSHLSQPFLKRCVEEDSDPALRLDLAPGLGFLSRRNVATAIVDGTLLIEPHSGGQDLSSDKCALCGCALQQWFANSGVPINNNRSSPATAGTSSGGGPMTTTTTAADQLNQTVKKMLGGRGWGFSRSNSSSNTTTTATVAPAQSPTTNPPPLDSSSAAAAAAAAATTSGSFSFPTYSPSHHPLDHSLQIHVFKVKDSATQRYAICPSYCLARLRAVCEFWTYVRVIERGLLLEEGFKFVQGRNETVPAASSNSAASSLHHVKSVNGSTVEVAGGGGGSRQGENRGLGIEARDFEALDTEMEGTPRIVEPEPADADADANKEGEGEEKEKKRESAAEAGAADPSPTAATKTEDGAMPSSSSSSIPGSPAISRPQTPSLGGGLTENANTSSSSVNKPNRPPRSSARGTASPKLGATPTTGGELIANSIGWEDRCWSEVVRLKESVFWTRVAAVSSDGGFVSARGAKVWVQ
ncbi:hypothetical protein JCM11491_003873 [Sporobolomyces phaffii]